MSDPLSAPPPKQPRPSPRQGAPRPPQSRESKFIGYLVLGFGILAVAAVLLLAFMGRGAPDTNVQQPTVEQAAAIAPAKPAELIQAPKPVPPPPAYKLPFKRQPDLNTASLDGNWQAMVGKFTGVLQMNKGVYQVVLASDDIYMPRYYSSGTYKVLEDMITFTPQNSWPKPISRSGGNYQTITRAPYSLMSAFYEGKMLWANLPPDEKRLRRHPQLSLFMNENVDYVVWQRIE